MSKKKKKSVSNDEEPILDRLTQQGHCSEALGTIVQLQFSKIFGKRNVKPINDFLLLEGKLVNDGNLESAERILITQVHTLNTLFNSFACQAADQEWAPHYETLMRLALKAQTQCRSTIETLANIKNPPNVAFVKQANMANNQQVKNVMVASRASENKNKQNQLLEQQHGKRLDIRAKSSTSNLNQELAAVGDVNRAKDRKR